MKCFEYIRITYDGGLREINELGSAGWEICAYEPNWKHLIMKRKIPKALSKKNKEFYTKLPDSL